MGYLRTTLIPPIGGVAAAHNGGKSQINVSPLYGDTGDFPFINHMLGAQEWGLIIGGSTNIDPSTLDANGYPTSIYSGGVQTVFFPPTQTERAGDYTISFTAAGAGAAVVIPGVGTYTATGAGTTTGTLARGNMSGLESTIFTSLTTRTNCRVQVQIQTPGVSNLHIFHSDDTAARNAAIARGQNWGGFGIDFLAKLRTGKWGVIRFLDWQVNNYGYSVKWSSRKPLSYYSFAARQVIQSLICSSGGSGNAFTITGNGTGVPASGNPADKQQVTFQANHTGTSTANTLALNTGSGGGTPYPIKYSRPYIDVLQLQNGTYYYGVFDAVLGCWIIGCDQGGGSNVSAGVFDGVPPDICLALCAEVGAHPYFVTPHLSFMTPSLYMQPLAQYIKSNYIDNSVASWMVPRFEGPNEQWNIFFAGSYSAAYATAVYGSASPGAYDDSWYGVGLSVMGQAINAVYGSPNPKTQTSYQILCGVRSASYTTTALSDARLNTTRTPSATSGGSAPYNWVTHVTCTGYINPNTQNKNTEFLAAFDYMFTYAGNTTQQNTIATNYANDCNVVTATFTGTIVGTNLSISGASGTIYNGGEGTLVGTGILYGTRVLSGSGTSYVVNNSQNVGPIPMSMHGLLTSYQAWRNWGNGFANPVSRVTNYEGGWSPDLASNTFGHSYIEITGATKANPCVLTVTTNKSVFLAGQNQFGDMNFQNLQSYPSGVNSVWINIPFTGTWAGLAGFYKILSGNDTSITIALNASGQASNFSGTINGEYFMSYSTASVAISGGTMTVSGWSGDPIVVGSTIYYSAPSEPPFNGANGYPKVQSFGTGTGGNGTYVLDHSSNTAGSAAIIFVETWWMLNHFRYVSRGVSAQQAITFNNYTDLSPNTTGGEFPSHFDFSGESIWGLFWPSIYSTPSPQWLGIVQFNS